MCYSFLILFRARLSLDGDLLFVRQALATVIVDRTELADWYVSKPPRGARRLVLRAANRTKVAVRIPFIFATDALFDHWLQSVTEAQPHTSDERSGVSLQSRRWLGEFSIWVILLLVTGVIAGWTAIARHPSDLQLGLDDAGRAVAERAIPAGARITEETLAPLTLEERGQLPVGLLGKLR